MTASQYFENGRLMLYAIIGFGAAITAALGFVGVALWRLGSKGAKHAA